jgi:hypothetical protein
MTDDSTTPAPERPPADAAAPQEGAEAPPGRAEEAVKLGLPPGAPSTAIQAGKPKAAAAAKSAEKKPPAHEMKDGFREVVETVVFVVVLVLLLKGFLAEAFVIPTGSMATTLFGYHENLKCPDCGYTFPINMSPQLDPEQKARDIIVGACCQNCEYRFYVPGYRPPAPAPAPAPRKP